MGSSSPPSSNCSEKESLGFYSIREIVAIWADSVEQFILPADRPTDRPALYYYRGRVPEKIMERFVISHPLCKELFAIVKVLTQAGGWGLVDVLNREHPKRSG